MIRGLQELNKKDIKNYSGVYIGGGNTYKLLNDLRTSGFLVVLASYIDSGGMVYGGSAGAIIFGKDISIVKDPNKAKITDFKGLNKIGKFSVFCHYSYTEKKRVERYVQKNEIPVIALPEKTGMIVNKDEAKVVGIEPVYLFDGKNLSKVSPGDKFKIRSPVNLL